MTVYYNDTLWSEELPETQEYISNQRVQYGDVWQLGRHRLLCGDCRTHDEIVLLMQGEVATLALHDPPYGIRYQKIGTFGDGAIKKGTGGIIARRGTFAPIYDDDKPFDPSHLLSSGFVVVIWGANHFADKLPASPAWILWDKRVDLPSNEMSDGEVAWVSTGTRLRIFRHRWYGFLRDSEKGEKRIHPTQKPVRLFQDIIEKYTKENELITDWYAGSGTTLIAAEITKRRAYVCEIEPHYCNIILNRYEKTTGQPVTLIQRNGGAA